MNSKHIHIFTIVLESNTDTYSEKGNSIEVSSS